MIQIAFWTGWSFEWFQILKEEQERVAYTIGDSSIQHAYAADAGIERNADAAELIVRLTGHLTGASSSVSNEFN